MPRGEWDTGLVGSDNVEKLLKKLMDDKTAPAAAAKLPSHKHAAIPVQPVAIPVATPATVNAMHSDSLSEIGRKIDKDGCVPKDCVPWETVVCTTCCWPFWSIYLTALTEHNGEILDKIEDRTIPPQCCTMIACNAVAAVVIPGCFCNPFSGCWVVNQMLGIEPCKAFWCQACILSAAAELSNQEVTKLSK